MKPSDIFGVFLTEKLNVINKEHIFEGILKWSEKDWKNRNQYFIDLLTLIPLDQLSSKVHLFVLTYFKIIYYLKFLNQQLN